MHPLTARAEPGRHAVQPLTCGDVGGAPRCARSVAAPALVQASLSVSGQAPSQSCRVEGRVAVAVAVEVKADLCMRA